MHLSLFNKYLLFNCSVFFIFIFLSLPGFGQSEKLLELQDNYATGSSSSLKEKIYVHTDRSFYLCGEIIWFKAYLTNSANNQPVSVSKVVYIEVLNQQHQPVLEGKLAMKNGMGNGSFFLPFSIESGNYIFRAYTNLMKNFSPDIYFEKNISIINPSRNLDSTSVHASTKYSAQFFPEGGILVDGLESKIAFKITGSDNKGAHCEGIVLDQRSDTVARFKSLQFGMGSFSLKPVSGNHYTAILNLKDGGSIKKDLPEAYKSGYVMHVTDTALNDLKISVSSNGLQINTMPFIYIIIQNDNRVNYVRLQRMENNQSVLILNKDSLMDGISLITIFDADKQPLCERLYFKRPKNKMLISAKAEKENYQTRRKITIDLSTTNQSKIPLSGDLSVAVYRLDNLHQPDPGNIFSYLWLSSNLEGGIESPDYYFKQNDPETNEALELLLLTQGWRKFTREKGLQNKAFGHHFVPEFGGHIITGRITSEITKEPVRDVMVYLSVPGKRVQLQVCKSDSEGLVHFEMKDFYGANQIVVQTNNELDSNYHLEIYSPFSENYSKHVFPAFHFSEIKMDDLLSDNLHMEVQNAYHENQLQQFVKPLVDTVPFYFKPFKTYLLGDYTRFTTMEEVMREYVNEVNVRRSGAKFRFMTVNIPGFELRDIQPAVTIFQNDPMVLLDGVPVFDINKIIAYDPLKVQKLEVVAEKYHYGELAMDGILSYTTLSGNLEGYTLDPRDLVLDYEGLQKQREFYSPQYTTEEESLSRMPDFRDLLFWSPSVKTNLNGNGTFSYFTGDIPGRYLVVVQGLATNGDAGSYSFTINVSKE